MLRVPATSWPASTSCGAAHFLTMPASLLSVLLPMLPQVQGLHLFGINTYWGPGPGMKLAERTATSFPSLYRLLVLRSRRTVQPVPDSQEENRFGKWHSLGPALLGAGFSESRQAGRIRDKSLLSAAGSHVWSVWLVMKFSRSSTPATCHLAVYFRYNWNKKKKKKRLILSRFARVWRRKDAEQHLIVLKTGQQAKMKSGKLSPCH